MIFNYHEGLKIHTNSFWEKPTQNVGFFIFRTSYECEIVHLRILKHAYFNFGNAKLSFAYNDKANYEIIDLAKNQKGYEAKSMDSYKKAIPYLEQALSIKPDDKTCISALRTLYYKTGNEAKGKEMSERMKK